MRQKAGDRKQETRRQVDRGEGDTRQAGEQGDTPRQERRGYKRDTTGGMS
jgi:hypothetical protein